MEAGLEPVAALPPKKKVRGYLLLLLLLGVAVYFLLPRLAAMQHTLLVISTLRIPFVLLALGAQLLSALSNGYLLRSVVDRGGKNVSVVDGAMMIAAANSVGSLGGGVLGTVGMAYLFLRRRGVNPGAAGLGGWLFICLNVSALAVVSLAGLLVLIILQKSSGLLAAGFTLVGLTLGAGVGALVWILLHREKLHALATGIARFLAKVRRKPPDESKIEAAIGHLLEGWDALVQGGWRGPAVGAILFTGFDMSALGFFFLAAGYPVNPAVLIGGYGVPQLLGKLTVILGGIGVVETTMVGLYALLGVPKATAIVVVLGYRLLSFWLPTLSGIALVPYLERRGSV